MFIVTGANGHLGRAIVESLVKLVSPEQVGATCRDLAKAEELAQVGVRVRQGDFRRPETLAWAFEGATRVLVVSSNAGAHGGDPLAQHRAAFAACRTARVKRVFYTSHMAVSDRSHFAPMHDHFATEAILSEMGTPWTSLRNGFYASSIVAMLGDAFHKGVIDAPEDGKVNWTTHGDLAEAAARLLVAPDTSEGPTPALVSAEAMNLKDMAALSSELTGVPCARNTVDDDEMIRQMVARGVPKHGAEFTLGFYKASRNGEFASASCALTEILGRVPTTMREFLTAALTPG